MNQPKMASGEGMMAQEQMIEQKRGLTQRAKITLVVIALLIISPIAYYLISPLFINVTVSEKLDSTGVQVLARGTFVGADAIVHKAEGTAKFIRTKGNEVRVRFEEDFNASNGPDLYVRLIKNGDVKDYVELGKLQGNIGSQSYAVPAGTDLSRYDSVIVWCKQFSVLFGTAKLASL